MTLWSCGETPCVCGQGCDIRNEYTSMIYAMNLCPVCNRQFHEGQLGKFINGQWQHTVCLEENDK